MMEIWNSYPNTRPLIQELDLPAYYGRLTPSGYIAIAVLQFPGSLLTNIHFIRGSESWTLMQHKLCDFAMCGGKWRDATRVVIAETYLSGITLAALCESQKGQTCVVAALSNENIIPVLTLLMSLADREFIVAPDNVIPDINKDVAIWTHKTASWVDLYRTEVMQCAA